VPCDSTDDVSPAAMEVARLYDGAVDDVKDGVVKILRATARARLLLSGPRPNFNNRDA
jgi:hypothetical protein